MAYKFNTNKEDFQKAVNQAKSNNCASSDSVAVVTINKLNAKARKCWYAFHFEKRYTQPKVGEVQQLEDGTLRRIEFICK